MAGRTGAGRGPTDENVPTSADPDLEDRDLAVPDIDAPEVGDPDDADLDAPDRGRTGRRSAQSAKAAAAAEEDLTLKASQMRGTEAMYGYLVVLLLIGVSILNLTDTHGKGAPTGPQHLFGATVTSAHLAVVGLVASVALLGVMQTRNRLIVPLAAIAAAFLTTLPKVPDSLSVSHLLALVVPVMYAFILTQRQRKSTVAHTRAGGPAKPRTTPAERRAEAAERRRSRRQGMVQTGPAANRRYTPPKAKRPRR